MARLTPVIIRRLVAIKNSSASRAAGILTTAIGWIATIRSSTADKNRYLTDVFSDAAIDFIERHKRENFFLQLAYNAPHFPLEARTPSRRSIATWASAWV